ncbi:MAG: ABC transporter permease [Deltaproteobacteria bacterium]|nr:ABC transporter permease [Deltaproteobacteria bacterium]
MAILDQSDRPNFLRASVLLIGLAWTLPFLQPWHRYPLTSFYSEWLAFALGLGAALALLHRKFWQDAAPPVVTIAPVGLIVVLGVQAALGRMPYEEQALTATLYLLWASLLMVLGHTIRRELGMTPVATTLAWFLLAGGAISALVGLLQHYQISTPFDSLVGRKAALQVYGNLGQPNHFAAYLTLSLASLLAARKYLSLAEYATVQRTAPIAHKLQGKTLALAWLVIVAILGVSLLPHIGILILSFSKVWSFTLLPTTYTLSNYDEILFRVPHFVLNTLLYTLLAAGLDIVLGAAIAYLLLRSRVAGKNLLDAIATMPLAIPGVVLAVGYLRVFHGWDFPGAGGPLTSSWFILVIAYTMRRLPYTVRACYAALQQVHISLEESAQNLGANRMRTFIRITLPMIAGGVVAGGLIAFVTSCVELASTIMLVPRIELGPISYGIYLYMQSPLGRGAGAALGVVAILLVSMGTYLTHRVFGGRAGSAFRI